MHSEESEGDRGRNTNGGGERRCVEGEWTYPEQLVSEEDETDHDPVDEKTARAKINVGLHTETGMTIDVRCRAALSC